MKTYRGFNDPALKPARRAVAIGVFDGVHRGHRLILRRMIAEARRLGVRTTVVTFDPHPVKVLAPKKHHPAVLMSLSHRLQVFAAMGIDETVVVPFTRAFASVPREDFFGKLLLKKLGAASLTVGADFRFGKKALGDGAYLKTASKTAGVRLSLVPQLKSGGRPVSSTRIRELVERGELREASRLLGRPVSVVGTVIHGRSRGKKIGFPTANLDPHHEALPPASVYAAYGYLGKKKLKGVLHIGERPTFKDRQKTLEVHFLGFRGDVYGRDVELIFVRRLRPILRFAGPQALVSAIRADIRRAMKIL